MKSKTFEIRDTGTFIPALAVQLDPSNEADRYLLSRAGYGRTGLEQSQYILLMNLSGGIGTYKCDPHEWVNSRTWFYAHDHIQRHFNELENGSVIDVEYILKETDKPKISESMG